MAHSGKTTNSSGWNAIFSWIKYALTGKRDETKAVSQSSVSASSLVELNARLESLEKIISSGRFGDMKAESLDAPNVMIGGVPVSPGDHTHQVKINGSKKTIAKTGDTPVDLGTYLTQHQDISGKADVSTVVDSASYNSSNHTIVFKHGSTQLFTLDAAAFVKDGMVDSVAISNGNLVITFNTDAGKQPISIALTDIFNPNNYYTKTETNTLLGGKVDSTDSRLLPNADEALILYGDSTYTNVKALYNAGKKLYLVTGGSIQPSGRFEYRIPLTLITYDANLEVNAFYFEQTQDDRAGASEVGSIAVYRLDSTGWTTTPKQVGYATNAGSAATAYEATNATNDHGGAKIRDAYLHGFTLNTPADQTGPEVENVTGIINVEPEINQDGFISAKMNLMRVSLTHVCRKSLPSIIAVNKDCSAQMPGNAARISFNSTTMYGYNGFTVLGHINPLADESRDRAYGIAWVYRSNWMFELDFDFRASAIPFENQTVALPSLFNCVFALKHAPNEFFYGFNVDDAGIFCTATTTCPYNGSSLSYGHIHMTGLIPPNAGNGEHIYLGAVQDSWTLGYVQIQVHNLQMKWITKSFNL